MKKSLLTAFFAATVACAGALSAVAEGLPQLHVKAISTNKVYGEELSLENLQFVLSVGGEAGSKTATSVDVAFTNAQGVAATPLEATAGAGTYGIVLSNIQGLDLAGYASEIVYESGVLTVQKAPLEITASSTRKQYGELYDFFGDEFVVTDGELMDGDSVDSVTLTSEGSPITATYCADGYPIVASNPEGRGVENYEITFVPGTLFVDKLPITVKAKDLTKVYGNEYVFAGTEFEISSGELINADTLTNVTLKCEGAAAKASVKEGGYAITPSAAQGQGLVSYAITYEPTGVMTVDTRKVSLTSDSASAAYTGQPLTKKSVTIGEDGFADGEGATCMFTGTQTYIGTSDNTFTYELNEGTLAGNYEIGTANGTLTVTKAVQPIAITADSAEKIYDGTELATAGYTYTTNSLFAGDMLLVTVAGTITSVGTTANLVTAYSVMRGADDVTDCYEVQTTEGTLEVKARALALTSASATKVYDGTPLMQSDVTAVGFVEGEGATYDVCGSQTIVGETANVFTYTMNEGTLASNYSIAITNGTLTVTKRKITLTSGDATGVYDGVALTNSTVTVGGDGFAEGEGAAYTYTGTQTKYGISTNFFGYSLNENTLGDNYEITTINGTLTVKQRPLTITADNTNKVYGTELVFAGTEFKTEGLVAGDTVANVTLVSEGSAAKAAYCSEGYVIKVDKAQGTGLENYAISYVDGQLAMERAAITITANDATKIYGDKLTFDGTEFTVSDGLQNGEQVTKVAISSAKAASTSTEVATYPSEIVPAFPVKGIDTNNYDIVFVNGNLLVTKAMLTLTVNDVFWRVGWTCPSYGIADFSSQLKKGDRMVDVVGGAGLAYTNRVWSKSIPTYVNEGTYPKEIWLDPASLVGTRAKDYQIQVVPGTLTIGSAVLEALYDHSEAEKTSVSSTAATEFNGIIYLNDVFVGTMQLKVAKANRRTGLAKVTISVKNLSGKSLAGKGSFNPEDGTVSTTMKDGTMVNLMIGADGFYGTYGAGVVEGVRNRYSSKDSEDRALLASASHSGETYGLAYEPDSGWMTYKISFASKGKVRVSGTCANGTKLSTTAVMLIGKTMCCVPVICSRNGRSWSFCIWLGEDEVEVTGIPDPVFGKVNQLAVGSRVNLDVDAFKAEVEIETTTLLADYLPVGAEVVPNGSKWIVMPDEAGKAMPTGRLVWDAKIGEISLTRSRIEGYNVSALKLSHNSSTGAITGSFKYYTIVNGTLKKKSVSVKGLVIDGVGYATVPVTKTSGVSLELVTTEE